MKVERYNFFIKLLKKHNSKLFTKTQKSLNKSKSKQQDYNILCNFWNKSLDVMFDYFYSIGRYGLFDELYCDSTAMQPMPESVSKQMVNMMFKIKNLNVLTDLPIYVGFDN